MYEDITIEDYKTRFIDSGEKHLLVDVRTIEEFEEVRLPGAVNIPLDEIDDRVDDIIEAADGAPVVMVCRTGVRSIVAAQTLLYSGWEDLPLFNLEEGTHGWAMRRYDLEYGTE